jgi:hypothetical protein
MYSFQKAAMETERIYTSETENIDRKYRPGSCEMAYLIIDTINGQSYTLVHVTNGRSHCGSFKK